MWVLPRGSRYHLPLVGPSPRELGLRPAQPHVGWGFREASLTSPSLSFLTIAPSQGCCHKRGECHVT